VLFGLDNFPQHHLVRYFRRILFLENVKHTRAPKRDLTKQ
jgi:hypothetical protein